MSNIKDTLTTVLAVILVVAAAVNTYLESLCTECVIEPLPLVIAVVVAIVAWFTGRNGDGSGKSIPTKV